MSGYAVMIDRSSYRAVAGPSPLDGDDLESAYPNYDMETYLPFEEGPPPDPIPLPPTVEQMMVAANLERDRLLTLAAIRIAPLQDAVDLDQATAEDVALLKKWKQYRVDVNRVPDQVDYPHNILWPMDPS